MTVVHSSNSIVHFRLFTAIAVNSNSYRVMHNFTPHTSLFLLISDEKAWIWWPGRISSGSINFGCRTHQISNQANYIQFIHTHTKYKYMLNIRCRMQCASKSGWIVTGKYSPQSKKICINTIEYACPKYANYTALSGENFSKCSSNKWSWEEKIDTKKRIIFSGELIFFGRQLHISKPSDLHWFLFFFNSTVNVRQQALCYAEFIWLFLL